MRHHSLHSGSNKPHGVKGDNSIALKKCQGENISFKNIFRMRFFCKKKLLKY